MLIIPQPFRSDRRKRRAPATNDPTPPAAELVLQSASYSKDAYTLTLTFDRPIALVDFSGATITVNDDTQLSLSFQGDGIATITSPDTVVVGLAESGPSTGPGQTFSATADTGIVAVDDGGTWGGATDQALPFP
jgi:hypothetical protein